ncbi:MAG: hypothetical protein LBD59_09085 [Prevotellaceae bacterium]|nr:hypothetical protein [Prevotellaceae bacterium]
MEGQLDAMDSRIHKTYNSNVTKYNQYYEEQRQQRMASNFQNCADCFVYS